MTKAPLRRISLLLLAGFTFALTTSGGCSRMSEGEHCDFQNAGDQDCDDGLVCVPACELVNDGEGADRCCPPVGQGVGDSRCQRGASSACTVPGAGGTTGGADAGGSGMGGTPSGGEGGTPGGGEGGQPPASMAGDGG